MIKKIMGCTIKGLKQHPNTVFYQGKKGRLLFTLSVLSDAQEALVQNNPKLCKQLLSQARFIIVQEMTNKEEGKEE